jgi:hypothetical protein
MKTGLVIDSESINDMGFMLGVGFASYGHIFKRKQI